MKTVAKKSSLVIALLLLVMSFVACYSNGVITGSFTSENAEKGRTITITFEKDGTFVWEETYTNLGDLKLTYDGTYEYNKEAKVYELDVAVGSGVFAIHTKYTLMVKSGTELVVNGTLIENEIFKKNK